MNNYSNIVSLLKESKYTEYGRHDLLISLSCIFENQKALEDVDWESDFEITFAVPIYWLESYMIEKTGNYAWGYGNIQMWLQKKYTSEDSQTILEKAVLENKVAFYFIDEKPILPF